MEKQSIVSTTQELKERVNVKKELSRMLTFSQRLNQAVHRSNIPDVYSDVTLCMCSSIWALIDLMGHYGVELMPDVVDF